MLFDLRGRRKYLTPDERRRFIEVALQRPLDVRSFCVTIALTGCRLSEALELTWAQLDHAANDVVLRSLKKRRRDLYRQVPVPRSLLAMVDKLAPSIKIEDARIWPWCRATGWKRVKEVFASAGIYGVHASPKGLRHGFAVAAIHSGVPLNLVQRWLGHADIGTTAIYANAMGEEERDIARRMWRATPAIDDDAQGPAIARSIRHEASRASNK